MMATEKMVKLNGLFIVIILFLGEIAATKKQFCPKICICDIYEDMKRADCSGQNLISTYTDVPTTVEVLYLSRNKISTLDNDELREYINIVVLDLSKNDIHTIYLDAFSKMHKLHRIDLASNRLEQLDSRIFELNEELLEIDLSNNKFMTVHDSPFIISDSLEILFLAESHMSHIFTASFLKLPKLKMLDISSNLLKNIDLKYFAHQHQLELLNLKKNPWMCDTNMLKLIEFYKKKKISILTDSCMKRNPNQRFEKILMGTVPATMPEDVDIDLVWSNEITNKTTSTDFKMPFEECDDESVEQNCDLLKICQSNYATLFDKYLEAIARNKNCVVHIESPTKCHGLTLGFLLFAGFFLGTIVGVSVMCLFSVCRLQRLFSSKRIERRRYQQALRDRNHFIQNRLLESPLLTVRNGNNVPDASETTVAPLPVAREIVRPVRSNSQRQQPQQQYQNATQELIQKLFRRPPRQPSPMVQVRNTSVSNSRPSTNNGLTTIGIRRLSDSSLESSINLRPPVSVLLRRDEVNSLDDLTIDCTDTLERSEIGRNRNYSNDSLLRLRTETPPPPYDSVTDGIGKTEENI